MAKYKIEFFGLCDEPPHNKVWGWVSIGEDSHLYNFWGARGKKYTFKRYEAAEKGRFWWNISILEKFR